MYKIKHITSQQLNNMVGTTLATKLWVTGMMNELRRYPNEIPCEPNEIPSMRIPFASGDEKVEWGFVAGASCLSMNQDGSILVQNAEHFPNCTILAILNLLYKGGITNGKKFSITLHIPDSPEIEVFTALLTEISTALRNLSITKVMAPKTPLQKQHNTCTVLALTNSTGVVQGLNQIDVGRFVVKVNCVNGSFCVGDNITVTDGSFQLLQEHCPVMQIVSSANQPVQSSDDLDGDIFFINLAMWFPPNTPPINGLMIIKEAVQPSFTPKPMPKPFVLQSQPSFADKKREEEEEAARARNQTYWEEHAEERAELERRKAELEAQFQSLTKEIDELGVQLKSVQKKAEVPVAAKAELENLRKQISSLTMQKNALGIFKGKEKKALQSQIEDLAAQVAALSQKVKQQEQELKERISAETAPISTKILANSTKKRTLQKEIDEINKELTKNR